MQERNLYLFSENSQLIDWVFSHLDSCDKLCSGKDFSCLKNFLLCGGILLVDGISLSEAEVCELLEMTEAPGEVIVFFSEKFSALKVKALFPFIRVFNPYADDFCSFLKSLPLCEKKEEFFFKNKKICLSPLYERYLLEVKRAASCDLPVLLLGESGSGKNYTGMFIHSKSARKDKEYLEVNVAEFNLNLIASELYGTVRGAFTGAENMEGFFSRAGDGTLLLDEIQELPNEHQAKLLGVMDSGNYRKTGSTECRTLKARLMFATDADLKEKMREGTFRKQLYYRISVLVIHVPPLREHPEDIIPLANSFAASLKKQLSSEALDKLCTWSWPGNIRELKNCIERACASTEEVTVTPEDILFV